MSAAATVSVRQHGDRRGSSFRPGLARAASAHAIIGVCTLAAACFGNDPGPASHAAWVGASALACILPFAREDIVRRIPSEPALTMIAAYLLYFVAGSAVPLAGDLNPEMQGLMDDVGTSWELALESDAMNSIGLSLALAACATLRCRWAGAIARRGSAAVGAPKAASVAMTFMCAGALVYVPLLVFLASGSGTGDLPGGQMLWRSGALMDCGILLAFMAARRGDILLPVAAMTLAVLQATLGLMAANKSEALTPIAIAMIAWVARRPDLRRAAVSTALAAGAYLLMTGTVGSMRSSPSMGTIGLSSRAELAIASLGNPHPGGQASIGWTALNRLCYLPAQTGAIALHRSGAGDAYLLTAPWLLVPRAVFQDKPVLSERGLRFSEQLSGQWGSSASPTLFIDGYYQFGWPGLMLVGWLCGWVLAAFGAFSTAALKQRAAVFLPLVIYGHFIAFRIDGVVIGDHLFGLVLLGLLGLASLAVAQRRARGHSGSDGMPCSSAVGTQGCRGGVRTS